MRRSKKQSFANRISWNIAILVLISNLTVCLVAYGFFYQRIVSEAITFGRNMLMANQKAVDNYFKQIDLIAEAIIYNESINNVLKSSTDTSDLMQKLKNVEQIYFHSRKDLSLFFYKDAFPENVYSIHANENYEKIADFKTSFWYKSLKASGEKSILLTNIFSEGEDSDFVHSAIYQIDDLYGDRAIGYLRIDMNLEQLHEQLILDYAEIEGVEILSTDGEVLFYSNNMLSLPEDFLSLVKGQVMELSTREAVYCFGISEETGWIVVLSISKSDLYQNEVIFFFFFLTFLFLSLAVGLFAVKRNTDILIRNMEYLKNGINGVKHGDLKSQIRIDDADEEINHVIIEFNEMVKQTHILMMKVKSKQTLLDEVQIKALQQQINPHFIYNSLETIMGMATEDMNKEIIEICKCISLMLRYNTKMEDSSTLGREINQVQNYTKVMEMRMNGSFKTEYSIDTNYLDAKIVKFALQPLVENAIGHGMVNVTSNGLIFIQVKKGKTENEIEIEIMDNGAGIIPETLKYLKDQLAMEDEDYLKQMSKSSTTGLLNVHLRLKLYFGELYHIEIESGVGEGTIIRILVPYNNEGRSLNVSSYDS